MEDIRELQVTRREVLAGSAASVATVGVLAEPAQAVATSSASVPAMPLGLTVNGEQHRLSLDPRTSLLDALRDHLHLTGTKKGCDHGQCGACTVIVNGRRINSCLSPALLHEGDKVTTIEGLGTPEKLHRMQMAFIRHDGFQCGFCTSGQICSAVAVLTEIEEGIPSHVTASLSEKPKPTGTELRERMSGNICRCAAYPNIIDAISEVAGGSIEVAGGKS